MKVMLMTDSQQKWVDTRKALINTRFFFSVTNLQKLSVQRRRLFWIVSSRKFENVIMACICLNTLLMCSQVSPSLGSTWMTTQRASSLFFTLIFNGEAALKISVLCRNYFQE